MDINIYQLIVLISWVILGLTAYKVKNIKVKIACVFLAFVAFFFNPIKFEQRGVVTLETGVDKFSNIPEKVVVDQKSFTEKQQEEMNKLKQESEEITNENE